MRVVFDSNIFISAIVFPGGSADAAVQRILEGTDTLLISRAIIGEVLGVLAEKFARSREELSRVAVLLNDMAESVKPTRRLSVMDDEPDNRILECAVAGRAQIIVTGDKSLLGLESFRGVEIVTLREYLEHAGS